MSSRTVGHGLCSWHLGQVGDVSDTAYCRKKTSYTMVWDGGEVGSTKVREYDNLCSEHQIKLRDLQNAE